MNERKVLSRLEAAGVISTSGSKLLEINRLANWLAQRIDYDAEIAILQFHCTPQGE